MLVDENSGSVISLEEAQGYISEFGKQYPDEAKAFFIGANHYHSILAQKDCIGIRIYNGYDTKDERMNQVLVGVDIPGNDMKYGVIIDRSLVCPPICPTIGIMD